MESILVTGANGFVGSALVEALQRAGFAVRGAFRSESSAGAFDGDRAIVGDLADDTDWTAALAGVTAVAHLAGPAHARYQEPSIRRAIVGGTRALAKQAARAGVERFVFVSSIKAAAARTIDPISERDHPNPEDAYGRAKLEAERALLGYPSINPVILRSPLVFAPNAKANFALLLKLANTPLPLPFLHIRNKRSLISLASLTEAILSVLKNPRGPSGVFHVADRPALSIAELVGALRTGMGLRERLFAAPLLAHAAPRVLKDNLEVDDSAFRDCYGYGAMQGEHSAVILAKCGAIYRANRA